MLEKDKDSIICCSMSKNLLWTFLFKTLKTSTWEFEVKLLLIHELKTSVEILHDWRSHLGTTLAPYGSCRARTIHIHPKGQLIIHKHAQPLRYPHSCRDWRNNTVSLFSWPMKYFGITTAPELQLGTSSTGCLRLWEGQAAWAGVWGWLPDSLCALLNTLVCNASTAADFAR